MTDARLSLTDEKSQTVRLAAGSTAHTDMLLLRWARQAALSSLTGDIASFPVAGDELYSMPRTGVFVTLRKNGDLRGCIGTFLFEDDLPTTLWRIAVAATRDPRFRDSPLSASEMTDVRIELSILSPLERIADPLDFELGRHGIYLRHSFGTGCFLPEVGQDEGWDREKFLSMLCSHKAGLSPAAWREAGLEIFRFTVRKILES